MQRLGLVGLPNSGKSTLFNALTGGDSPVAPYPFSTTETHLGEAKVADERLIRIAALSRSAAIAPATVQFTDLAGLAKGSRVGEGLGNRFLGAIREVDALVLVLANFGGDHIEGATDPLEALGALEVELSLADLESLERQMAKKRRDAKGDGAAAAQLAPMERAAEALSSGTPLWRSDLSAAERESLVPCFLLTAKPVIAVLNSDEASRPDVTSAVAEALDGAVTLAVCAQLEAEVAELAPAERAEMAAGLGLGEGAVARLVGAAYEALGLCTFFTTGPKETRAWPFAAGSTADVCAGLIHSDFARGFIRAETIYWSELLEIGSWAAARTAGRLRLEGRGYKVVDGDVLEIRFNT